MSRVGATGALTLLLGAALREVAAQESIEVSALTGDVYAKTGLVPRLSSAVSSVMQRPFEQALEFTEAAGRAGSYDRADRVELSRLMYTQTLSTGCGSNEPGNAFDMIYLGLENGIFAGYFSPSSFTYRPPSGTFQGYLDDQLSWAPYTLDSINGVCDATPGVDACDFSNATSPKIARKACAGDDAACAAADISGGGLTDPWERLEADRASCTATGDCTFSAYGGRDWDGKVAAMACERTGVDNTSSCAHVDLSGEDDAADRFACESDSACAYTPAQGDVVDETCTKSCTDTCCDGDLRVYYTSNPLGGAPLEMTRWRVYDPRARGWYIQQRERFASIGDPFGWSGVYTFATSGSLGITATAMLHDSDGVSFGVAGVDYTLASISGLLIDELSSLGADSNATFAYVVERTGSSAGTLMGSSTDDATDLSTGSVVRLHATAQFHPGARLSAEYLESEDWPVVDGIALSQGDVHIEVGTFSFEDRGLVWLIVVGQHTNCPATDIWQYGKCHTCEGGKEPVDNVCVDCAEGYAGMGGSCLACTHGSRPNLQKTACDACPVDQIFVDGDCVSCPFLTVVNQDPLTAPDMPCVCEKGMFDLSDPDVVGAFCFGRQWQSNPFGSTDEYDYLKADKDKQLRCSTCPPCMDCVSNPGTVVLNPGWKSVAADDPNSEEVATIDRVKISANVVALKCPIEGACLGDTVVNGTIVSKCATGYTGYLCAVCAKGYTVTLNGCEECTAESLTVIPIIVVVIIVISIAYVRFQRWFTEGGAAYAELFFEIERMLQPIGKVFVTTSQIVGSIPLTMGVTFPPAMMALVNFLRIFALDVFVILRSNCLFGNSFYAKFLSSFTLPIIIIGLVFAYSILSLRNSKLPDRASLTEKQLMNLRDEYEGLASRDSLHGEEEEVTAADIAACCEELGIDMSHDVIDSIIREGDESGDGKLSFEEFLDLLYRGSGKFPELVAAYDKRRHMQGVYAIVSVIVFMLYPGVCQTAFASLRCRDIGKGVSVLEADYTIDCNSSNYQIFRVFAVLVIVAIPVGIPLGAYLIMRKHREKILAQDRDTIREFNSLLGDYEPECVLRH